MRVFRAEIDGVVHAIAHQSPITGGTTDCGIKFHWVQYTAEFSSLMRDGVIQDYASANRLAPNQEVTCMTCIARRRT